MRSTCISVILLPGHTLNIQHTRCYLFIKFLSIILKWNIGNLHLDEQIMSRLISCTGVSPYIEQTTCKASFASRFCYYFELGNYLSYLGEENYVCVISCTIVNVILISSHTLNIQHKRCHLFEVFIIILSWVITFLLLPVWRKLYVW